MTIKETRRTRKLYLTKQKKRKIKEVFEKTSREENKNYNWKKVKKSEINQFLIIDSTA